MGYHHQLGSTLCLHIEKKGNLLSKNQHKQSAPNVILAKILFPIATALNALLTLHNRTCDQQVSILFLKQWYLFFNPNNTYIYGVPSVKVLHGQK